MGKIEKSKWLVLERLLFCLIPFSFSIHKKLLVPLIILSLLSILIRKINLKEKFSFKIEYKKKTLLFILPLLTMLIAIIPSSDKAEALFQLEKRLSLIVFPVLIIIAQWKLDHQFIERMIKFFVYGLITHCVMGLINAFYQYGVTGNNNFMVYDQLSFHYHPTFLALYLNIAILMIYQFVSWSNKLKWIISSFFILMILMLLSRSGYIGLVILGGMLMMDQYRKSSYKPRVLGFLLGSVVVLFAVIALNSKVHNRILEPINEWSSLGENKASSSAYRVALWDASVSIIKEKPYNTFYGVGSGDVELSLQYKLEELGYTNALKKNFNNPHNQFFNDYLAIGIIGAIGLFLSLSVLWFSLNNKIIIRTFVLLFVSAFMFDTILNSQPGLVVYAFFGTIFILGIGNEQREEYMDH